MRVTLNWTHIALWGRFAVYFGLWMGAAIIGGWHLKPRLDEVVFVALLPVPLVLLYATGCFCVAAARVWLWPAVAPVVVRLQDFRRGRRRIRA